MTTFRFIVSKRIETANDFSVELEPLAGGPSAITLKASRTSELGGRLAALRLGAVFELQHLAGENLKPWLAEPEAS